MEYSSCYAYLYNELRISARLASFLITLVNVEFTRVIC